MKTHLGILIICISLFCSCGPKWTISVHEQKIKNSPFSIYVYEGSGGRDSFINGFTINDTNEKTEILDQKHLPSRFFLEIPNKDSIKLLQTTENDNFTNPTKKTLDIIDIVIEVKTIKSFPEYSNSGCGLHEYKFSSFKETNDSLFFFNAKKKNSNENVDLITLGFEKGNITIIETFKGLVEYVRIEQLIVKKINNFEAGCSRTYFFTSTKELKTSAFSDFGIFKPIHDK
jgi:hypothetical protein